MLVKADSQIIKLGKLCSPTYSCYVKRIIIVVVIISRQVATLMYTFTPQQ